MLALFLSAFLLGLVFNAAPGAVFAETIRQGVRGGYRPALLVQLGSLTGDALWALLGLAGVGVLVQADALRLPIGIAGVLYLFWLSYDAWRASHVEFGQQLHGTTSKPKDPLRAGVLLSITNPQNIAYWAAVGSALGALGVKEPTMAHYGTFFAGFMVASVAWAFVCAALIATLFRNATQAWAKLTYRACALAFFLLALSSLRDLRATSRQKETRSSPATAPAQP